MMKDMRMGVVSHKAGMHATATVTKMKVSAPPRNTLSGCCMIEVLAH